MGQEWTYEAADKEGKLVRGIIACDSPVAVCAKLRELGFQPKRISLHKRDRKTPVASLIRYTAKADSGEEIRGWLPGADLEEAARILQDAGYTKISTRNISMMERILATFMGVP